MLQGCVSFGTLQSARTLCDEAAASDFIYFSAFNYVINEGFIDVNIASDPIIDFTKKNSLIEINEWQYAVCFTADKDRNTHVRRQEPS